MKDHKQNHESDFEPQAPEALKQDIRALYEADLDIPCEVDERILAEARKQAPPQKTRIISLRWAVAAAAAACVLVAISFLMKPSLQSTRRAARAPAQTTNDFDGNGRVNIVDAYQLARTLEETGRAGDDWDLNGDGTVDSDDVERLAMAAVRLKRESGQ